MTRKKRPEDLNPRSPRVSGGVCDKCGFHKLPTGECGVCGHRRRLRKWVYRFNKKQRERMGAA